MPTDNDDLDREMLDLCIAIARRDPDYSKRIDKWIQDGEEWFETAASCCYHVQIEDGHLLPWQNPLCAAHTSRDPLELAFLERAMRAGLSRYDPTPMKSLLAAEAKLAKMRAAVLPPDIEAVLVPEQTTAK